MKKLVLVVLMFVLFTGVVSASSLNGDYKGNPIVKLKSNGSLIDSGAVPAMIYDDKTMVPIAALRNLGVEVNWDQNTYSVDVKLPNNDSNNSNDINKLKLYSKIADQYKKLTVLGDILASVSQSFSDTYKNIEINFQIQQSGDHANLMFNNAINSYNDLIPVINSIITDSSAQSIPLTDMNSIIAGYGKSIEYYRNAYKGLEDFASSKSNSDYMVYSENNKQAFDTMDNYRKDSISGYFKYYNMIQNF
jgi:hypothetical protein